MNAKSGNNSKDEEQNSHTLASAMYDECLSVRFEKYILLLSQYFVYV